MSYNNRYKIYPEINFGIARFEPGVKSFEELYHYAVLIRKDENFKKVNYHLTDLRGCTFDFEISKLKEMVDLIDQYQSVDRQNIGIYLIDEPIATAYIQLFFESLEYKRDLCSTLQTAYRLLKLPVTYSDFLTLVDI